jgi:hypothetical protein
MSNNDKETKKAAHAFSEALRLFTKENILTTATKEEYEGGEFKFKSVGGHEIGRWIYIPGQYRLNLVQLEP